MLRRVLVLGFIAAVISQVLGEKQDHEYERDIARYFRELGFRDWSEVPDGKYVVPVDKYTTYEVEVKKEGDESTPDNCQISVTSREVLYFGGFFRLRQEEN